MSDTAAARGAAPDTVSELYGLAAEFREPEQIMYAAHEARRAGFTRVEAYTPFFVDGLDAAIGHRPSRLGWVVLLMGIAGMLGGFLMQWYSTAVYYPLNVGGRPLNSWPNYIVITFEITVLLASFTAGLVMLARNGLPRLHHPIFNTANFEAASRDRFFLCIEADDPRFDRQETRAFLEGLTPERVSEVER